MHIDDASAENAREVTQEFSEGPFDATAAACSSC
jgi:hypothetical protein